MNTNHRSAPLWNPFPGQEFLAFFLQDDYLVTQWLAKRYGFLFSYECCEDVLSFKPVTEICPEVARNPWRFRMPRRPRAIIVGWRLRKILHDSGKSELFASWVCELKNYYKIPAIILVDRDGFYAAINNTEAEPFDLILNSAGFWKQSEFQNYQTYERYIYPPDEAKKRGLIEPLYCFSAQNLAKVRASFLFVAEWANEENLWDYWKFRISFFFRRFRKDFFEKKQIFLSFIGSLNNIKRFDVVRKVKEIASESHCKLRVERGYINGVGDNRLPCGEEAESKFCFFENTLKEVDALEGEEYSVSRFERWHRDSKVSLCIPGHDPLSARIFHAFKHGSLVLIESLSAYQIQYPFQEGKNVLYYEHTALDALEEKLKDIEKNWGKYEDVAIRGMLDYLLWNSNPDKMVYDCLIGPIDEMKGESLALYPEVTVRVVLDCLLRKTKRLLNFLKP